MKIGILGGTFDPIHNGHLAAAELARHSLQLERVLLVPSRTPPHRMVEPRASAFHRFAMTALAAMSLERTLCSDLELQREGPSYTSLTLESLHREGFAPSDLFFILGADAFAEISSWHNYPRVLEMANFVVVARPGAEIPERDAPHSSAATSRFLVNAVTPDVSSTGIRRRLSEGESIDDLVPPAVGDYIRRQRLYVPTEVTVT
jgi:nicotinate-nucleotide adenylyltransferase